MTVSLVLRGREGARTSPATRDAILAAARKLGYRPNGIARALRTGRSNTIAFCAPEIGGSFTGRLLAGVTEALKARKLQTVVFDMGSPAEQSRSLERVFSWPLDGILAFDAIRWLPAYLEAFPTPQAPVVSMGAYYTKGADLVALDLRSATYQAVRHLLGMGCERVAFLVRSDGEREGDPRYDGYCQAMREAELATEYIPVGSEQGLARAKARQALQDHVRDHGCPDGIFCYNDDMAIGANRGLYDMGLRCPRDVLLFGCDGVIDTEYHVPSLSTIAWPIEEMCSLACDFVSRRLKNPDLPPQEATLDAELVLRESSDPRIGRG